MKAPFHVQRNERGVYRVVDSRGEEYVLWESCDIASYTVMWRTRFRWRAAIKAWSLNRIADMDATYERAETTWEDAR